MSKINISELVLSREDDFIFNLLEIENFNSDKSPYKKWYQHLIKYGAKLEGDIFEFGTFKGKSIIAMAILCKKLKINKTIYGFDSFSGFPSYHKFDQLNNFNKRYFNKQTIIDHKINFEIKKFTSSQKEITVSNISTSNEFKSSHSELLKKIKFLKLNNIKLIKGDFAKSIPKFISKYDGKVFSANVDCDLYDGYRISLEFILANLIKKGFVNLDEYYSLKFPGAKIATDMALKESKIELKFFQRNSKEFKRFYLFNK